MRVKLRVKSLKHVVVEVEIGETRPKYLQALFFTTEENAILMKELINIDNIVKKTLTVATYVKNMPISLFKEINDSIEGKIE